jgi:hypothetical protein
MLWLLSGVGLAVLALRNAWSPLATLVTGMLASVPLHAFLVWHADPMEVARHSAVNIVTARLAVFVAAVLLIDHTVERGRDLIANRRHAATSSSGHSSGTSSSARRQEA